MSDRSVSNPAVDKHLNVLLEQPAGMLELADRACPHMQRAHDSCRLRPPFRLLKRQAHSPLGSPTHTHTHTHRVMYVNLPAFSQYRIFSPRRYHLVFSFRDIIREIRGITIKRFLLGLCTEKYGRIR